MDLLGRAELLGWIVTSGLVFRGTAWRRMWRVGWVREGER